MRNALIFPIVSVSIACVGVCVCEFVCAQGNVTEPGLKKKYEIKIFFQASQPPNFQQFVCFMYKTTQVPRISFKYQHSPTRSFSNSLIFPFYNKWTGMTHCAYAWMLVCLSSPPVCLSVNEVILNMLFNMNFDVFSRQYIYNHMNSTILITEGKILIGRIEKKKRK